MFAQAFVVDQMEWDSYAYTNFIYARTHTYKLFPYTLFADTFRNDNNNHFSVNTSNRKTIKSLYHQHISSYVQFECILDGEKGWKMAWNDAETLQTNNMRKWTAAVLVRNTVYV